jgi:hypothetical protein
MTVLFGNLLQIGAFMNQQLGNMIISILILILTIAISFTICALGIWLAELLHLNTSPFLPGVIITIILFPILNVRRIRQG